MCRPSSLLLTFFLALSPFLASLAPQSARGEEIKITGYEVVPLQAARNKVAFSAEVNGRRGTMFVDTGAFVSMLDEGFARRINLKYPGDEGVPPNIPKTITSGQNKWRVAWVSNMRAGSMSFGSGPMAISAFSGGRSDNVVGSYVSNSLRSSSFDGLIGNDILFRYNAIIDCLRNRIYLNTDPARRMHLASMAASAGYVGIPMSKIGHHFYVPASVGGSSFSLLVDTGSFATLLNAGTIRSLNIPLTRHNAKATGFYGRSDIYTLTASNLSVGNFPLTRPQTIAATDLPGVFPGSAGGTRTLGIMGMDSLAFNAALIDYGDQKLYLHKVSERPRR